MIELEHEQMRAVAEALRAQGHAARLEGGGAAPWLLEIDLPGAEVALVDVMYEPGGPEWWASVYASAQAVSDGAPALGDRYMPPFAVGEATADATEMWSRLTDREWAPGAGRGKTPEELRRWACASNGHRPPVMTEAEALTWRCRCQDPL